jgi:hypothetical protein
VVFITQKYRKRLFDQLGTVVVIVGFSFDDLLQITQVVIHQSDDQTVNRRLGY